MRGVLGSLADPSPGVLGVLLDADDGCALEVACGREARPMGARPLADLWRDALEVDGPAVDRVGSPTDRVDPPGRSDAQRLHSPPGDAVATAPSLCAERADSPDPADTPDTLAANRATGATPVTDRPPATAAAPKRGRRRRGRR